MKILLHYEDNETLEYHKSLKMTLPKSWKTGPISKLVDQFVETYNGNETFATANPLTVSDLHLAIRTAKPTSSSSRGGEEGGGGTELQPLASDAVVLNVLTDRADVYVMHGPAPTLADQAAAAAAAATTVGGTNSSTPNTSTTSATTAPLLVACTHFGCKQRFPPDGPYPDCIYHAKPPVFHETAKYWACCPGKKAYDWEDFERIPGCQRGICTRVKPAASDKMFLGGTDLREAANGGAVKLKSIDDFNQAQAAGGAQAAPVLDRLQKVLVEEMGIDKELYQQVLQGIRTQIIKTSSSSSSSGMLEEAELLEAIKKEMGDKLKQSLKDIAAKQLRLS
jgi:CHORD